MFLVFFLRVDTSWNSEGQSRLSGKEVDAMYALSSSRADSFDNLSLLVVLGEFSHLLCHSLNISKLCDVTTVYDGSV